MPCATRRAGTIALEIAFGGDLELRQHPAEEEGFRGHDHLFDRRRLHTRAQPHAAAESTTKRPRTNINSNSDRRNIRLNVSIFFHSKISERSTLSFNVSGKYAPGDRDGWRVDTTASTPGLQVKLRNDGDSRNYSFGANLGYRYKLGKKGSVNASYNFSRDYARSKQLAVDFLSDPQGVVDTVNSTITRPTPTRTACKPACNTGAATSG